MHKITQYDPNNIRHKINKVGLNKIDSNLHIFQSASNRVNNNKTENKIEFALIFLSLTCMRSPSSSSVIIWWSWGIV